MTGVKKEKVVSAKGDEAEEIVLNYLIQQNRPYGATDISANLKNRVSKPQAQKALSALHERGEIIGKAFGKTSVYCALQSEVDTLSPAEIATAENEVKMLKEEEKSLKEEARALAAHKVEVMKTPITAELKGKLEQVNRQCTTIRDALALIPPETLASSTASPIVSSTALAELSSAHTRVLNFARQRRKIVKEVEGMLLDMFDKKKGEEENVWEEIGGEWLGEWEKEVWKGVQELEAKEKKGGKGG